MGHLFNKNLVQRCMEEHSGKQRGVWRCTEGAQRCAGCVEGCAEGCMEVHKGVFRGAWKYAEVSRGVHIGVAPSNNRFSG